MQCCSQTDVYTACARPAAIRGDTPPKSSNSYYCQPRTHNHSQLPRAERLAASAGHFLDDCTCGGECNVRCGVVSSVASPHLYIRAFNEDAFPHALGPSTLKIGNQQNPVPHNPNKKKIWTFQRSKEPRSNPVQVMKPRHLFKVLLFRKNQVMLETPHDF